MRKWTTGTRIVRESYGKWNIVSKVHSLLHRQSTCTHLVLEPQDVGEDLGCGIIVPRIDSNLRLWRSSHTSKPIPSSVLYLEEGTSYD